MKLTILGSGDAFSSGARLPSCYALESGDHRILIDCGPAILPALKRAGLSGNRYSHIVISHLHGDHFAGLPFFLIDAMFPSKRQEPLTLIGPPGLEVRLRLAFEVMYPRMSDTERKYDLHFIEIEKETPLDVAGFRVTAYEVDHYSGAPSYALRFERGDKIFAFSGDSGWTDNLIRVGQGADLYLMECYQFDLDLPMHLTYKRIDSEFHAIGAKKIMLTHMADAMLAKLDQVDSSRYLIADDGMTLSI
ncbi:MAG TPA: MBL fold metallo-hydrolase [Hyphomicrobiales bacterium]|nr:MBL fold metallo-hydrolase [Hyphomicrobiales bacterium]